MATENTSDAAGSAPQPPVRRAAGPGRWDGVGQLAYKSDGASPFRDVTRQILFADPRLAAELRYFEVAPGGHSTLERHRHVHAVMIHLGRGRCLIGDAIHEIAAGDLVFVPPMTWHQFRASAEAPLGFLCLVDAQRDRPQLPAPDDLAALKADPAIADFIRT